jgi:hypothetical protein
VTFRMVPQEDVILRGGDPRMELFAACVLPPELAVSDLLEFPEPPVDSKLLRKRLADLCRRHRK